MSRSVTSRPVGPVVQRGVQSQFSEMRGTLRRNWRTGERHDPHVPQFVFKRADGRSFRLEPTADQRSVLAELGKVSLTSNAMPFTIEAYEAGATRPTVGGLEAVVARTWYAGHTPPEV